MSTTDTFVLMQSCRHQNIVHQVLNLVQLHNYEKEYKINHVYPLLNIAFSNMKLRW